jgi:hypothetical protein
VILKIDYQTNNLTFIPLPTFQRSYFMDETWIRWKCGARWLFGMRGERDIVYFKTQTTNK